MVDLPTLTVPIHTDEDGTIKVANTRIPIDTLIICHQQGDTPEQIHEGFPSISVSDVYALIAYYLANRAELDDYLKRRQTQAAAIRHDVQANYPPELKARMDHMRVLATAKRKQESS